MNPAQGCVNCTLHQVRQNVVWGEGPEGARLFLLGEAPGPLEDRTGRPFVGKAGQLLRRVLRDVGLDETEVYFSNRVRCFPGYRDNAIAKPDVPQLAACLPWLRMEIELVNPAVVVCLGSTASKLPFPDLSITKACGKWRAMWSRAWTATYHPSYVARGNREALGVLMESLRSAKEYAYATKKETEPVKDIGRTVQDQVPV